MYFTEDYKELLEIFNEHEVKYLVAGAFAMSKLGYSRATYDIDLWVEKSKENAIKIVNSLEEFGVPFELSPNDFLEPNCVIQIGNIPNRIDILTDIDGLNFKNAWQNKNKIIFIGISRKPSKIDPTIGISTESMEQINDLVIAPCFQIGGSNHRYNRIHF